MQCKIVLLLGELESGKQISDNEALENWLSRYYFNSGMQRINFAAERLMATTAALPCVCGARAPELTVKNNRAPKFQERLAGAKARLQHIETEYRNPLTDFKAVLAQLDLRYERNDAFDPAKGLAMIRQDVNTRKHSIYKRCETLDSLPRPASGTVTWSDSGFHARMQTAVECLELASGAYDELMNWYPAARF